MTSPTLISDALGRLGDRLIQQGRKKEGWAMLLEATRREKQATLDKGPAHQPVGRTESQFDRPSA